MDVAFVVTADHGHLTVPPDQMLRLPPQLSTLLEYSNVGVHGRGRHATFHVRRGQAQNFERLWLMERGLRERFILLPTDRAAQLGLFGPQRRLLPTARRRLGDFVALATTAATLVTEEELHKFNKPQGSHGSMLPAEMRTPFVLLTPETTR